MIIRVVVAALIAATLCAQTSSISGTIRNAHNQVPIPGALVRLDDGENPRETFTDAAGHYRFSDIDQVTYNLRIEKEGYLFQPDYALPNQGSIVPFLNALAATATTVTLDEGATANPKIKERRWPD